MPDYEKAQARYVAARRALSRAIDRVKRRDTELTRAILARANTAFRDARQLLHVASRSDRGVA